MKKRKSGWELESGSAEEKNNAKCDAGAAGCSLLAGRGGEERRPGGGGSKWGLSGDIYILQSGP